jgi:hypothetical protein
VNIRRAGLTSGHIAGSWQRHYRGAYSDAFPGNDAAGYLLPLRTERLAIPDPPGLKGQGTGTRLLAHLADRNQRPGASG